MEKKKPTSNDTMATSSKSRVDDSDEIRSSSSEEEEQVLSLIQIFQNFNPSSPKRIKYLLPNAQFYDPKSLQKEESVEEEEDEEKELKRELADVTFEEMQNARSCGFHSTFRKPNSENKLRRANKNRPMEMSSKKPVGRFREVIQAPKKVTRDPRFESLCGTLDTEGFRKRYNFLFEVELPAEREKLKKLMKKSNDPKVIEELKNHISWIDKQLKSGSAKGAEARILAEHKRKEREAAKKGKRPFYLTKSAIREQKLIKKYNDLTEKGKVEAFMEKRRRRNAAKDRRYMPYRRVHESE